MKCDELRELYSAIMDGEASAEEEREADAHLLVCQACTRYRAGMESDRRQLKLWPVETPGWRPLARRPPRRHALAWAMAAWVLAFGAGLSLGLHLRPTPRPSPKPPSEPTSRFEESWLLYPATGELHIESWLPELDPTTSQRPRR